MWDDIGCMYPLKVSKHKFFNAGTIWTSVISMLKALLPQELREKFEFGCQFEQRLDSLYLLPTLDDANQRFLGRVEETLQRRYYNETNFRL